MTEKKWVLYKKFFTKKDIALKYGFKSAEAFIMSSQHDKIMDVVEFVIEVVLKHTELTNEEMVSVIKEVLDKTKAKKKK